MTILFKSLNTKYGYIIHQLQKESLIQREKCKL